MTETAETNEHRFVKYIKHLKMKKHPQDNVFFVETIRSSEKVVPSRTKNRSKTDCEAYTVIYYLLTAGCKDLESDLDLESDPFMPFHSNKSDIVHFFHDGWPITYIILDPVSGKIEEIKLGPDLEDGHQFHVMVDGGKFKAATIDATDINRAKFKGEIPFALVSEQVAPGFDYADHKMYTKREFGREHPHVFEHEKYRSLVIDARKDPGDEAENIIT